jgi:hypothetical protein
MERAMSASYLGLLTLVVLGLLLLGAVVGIVLLLSHPKTRVATFTVLGVGAAIVVVLVAGMIFVHKTARVQPFRHSTTIAPPIELVRQSGHIDAQKPAASNVPVASSPQTPKPASAEAVAKGEDEVAKEIAAKTVGLLRAMVRALGRALAEEEQSLAAKKNAAIPVPAAAAKGAGGEGSKAVQPALTLTLSQGETGPNQPKTRPAWVSAPPQLVGDAYQMSMVVGPYTTRQECDAKLPEAVQEALSRYAETAVGPEAVGMVRLPDDYLRHDVVVNQWEETRQYSVGPMVLLHLQLQFDVHVKSRVREAYRQAVVAERLYAAGTWSAIAIAILTVLFGYLKIDLATGGAYRGRLRLGAATVILGLVAVVVTAMV